MSETDAAVEGVATSPEQRPGQMLAEARVSKNLSVAEVAQQLKLSTGQVEALEADAYDRLPGPVFVRGFVRNYARVLNLDSEALVALVGLRHEALPASAAVPHSHNIPFPEQNPVKWRGYAAGLVILLSAVALFEVFVSPSQSIVVVAPPPESAVAPVVVPPVQTNATEALSAPAIAELPKLELQKSDSKKSEPNKLESQKQDPKKVDAVPVTVVAEPVKTAAGGKGQVDLHFVFTEQSWIEVRDRNNRLLLSQLNPAGSEQHVQGSLPLSLIVGNAHGVRLRYNGQPFDLVPHTKVAVARLTLE